MVLSHVKVLNGHTIRLVLSTEILLLIVESSWLHGASEKFTRRLVKFSQAVANNPIDDDTPVQIGLTPLDKGENSQTSVARS